MKDKGHFYVSLAKSVIRIAGCVAAIATWDARALAIPFLIAEGLGIIEEVADKR